MAVSIKAFIAKQLTESCSRFLVDLAALDEGVRANSPGGSARCTYDYTYECAVVNRRVAARMRAEDPGPWPFGDGWAKAPDDHRSLEAATHALQGATDDLIATWNAFPEDKIDVAIPIPNGEMIPVDMVHLCAMHMSYHDAQLNLLQAMHGDETMHWDD